MADDGSGKAENDEIKPIKNATALVGDDRQGRIERPRKVALQFLFIQLLYY